MVHASATTPMEPGFLRLLLLLRIVVLVAVHLAVFAAALILSFLLRFDFRVPPHMEAILWHSLPWVALVKLTIFCLTGNFFGWWRYVTFADLSALLCASALSTLIVIGIDYLFISAYQIPRSVPLMDFGFTVLLLGGLRSSIRFGREHFRPMVLRKKYAKALIIGADEAASMLASRIHNHGLNYRIVGFLDSDKRKHGTRLGGIPVLGELDRVCQIANRKGVEHVLVTAGHLSGPMMRDLVKRCDDAKLSLKILPALKSLLEGHQRINVRDVDIDDLLGREPVQLDSKAIGELLRNKTIMVTGAGGSIGSEICRQALKFQPTALVLVEQAENNLFYLERELKEDCETTVLHACIADILDSARMNQLFAQFHPDVVFHAAAHKHVPLMELNASEAIKNNVLGTRVLANLAHDHGVKNFVLISSDKAVKPTSVMGASKQLAEQYVYTLSQESSTKFIVVRFGNVLGSAGSVVPVFQEQIRRGGPVTVTDERMTRYFMTIPEAAQLVLQSGTMGRGGEIFVLDMGSPIKIVDLARDLIRLSGFSEDDIPIEFTGIRPGEKLYEELYFDDEETLATRHPKVWAAFHRPYSKDDIRKSISELEQILTHDSDAAIRAKLHQIVPDFRAPKLDDVIESPVAKAKRPSRLLNSTASGGQSSWTNAST
jgi:FlaA1/EpsC-like NDP-sugar epimerase